MAGKLGDHPGFQAVQRHIAEASNMPMDQAGAVAAAAARNASSAAKRANPNLKKVKGKSKSRRGGNKSNPSSPSNNYMFDQDRDGY